MSEFAGLPRAQPEEVGFSSTRLDRITQTMADAIKAGAAPGTATVVARRGRVVHVDVQGSLDIERGNPLPLDALYRMYSQTKPVTAAVAMTLFEDGVIFLDDPITKFLPEFANLKVVAPRRPGEHVRGAALDLTPVEAAHRDVRIFDLMTMTSGIPAAGKTPAAYADALRPSMEGAGFWPGDMRINDPPRSYEDMVLSLAQVPLYAQPGTAWNYGSDFDVLTLLLERASGQPIDALFRQRILDPLGMVDSDFYCPADKLDRLVTDHQWAEDGSVVPRDRPETAEKAGRSERKLMSGNGMFGGMLSTPADYTRFAQMLLNGGHLDGVQVLGRKTVKLMTADHIGDMEVDLVSGPGYGFGLGYAVRRGIGGSFRPGSAGTHGWGGAAGTWFFVDPAEELIGLFFTHIFGYQFSPTADLYERFEKLTYEALV